MNVQPGAADGNSELRWGTPNTDSGTRTTKSATFVTGGKEYTVTVSYNRQAVMDKYRVEDSGVDAKMEEVISRIGNEQLSKLSGHSISTSLSDPVHQARFKKIGESEYRALPADIPSGSEGDILRTINAVTTVFTQVFPHVSVPNQRRVEDEDLDDEGAEFHLTVENNPRRDPEGESPTVRFHAVTVEDEFQTQETRFQSVGKTLDDYINEEASRIEHELSSTSPLKTGPLQSLKVLTAANIDTPDRAPIEALKAPEHKAKIVELLNDGQLRLSNEQKHEALNQLSDQYFADTIRVELGLQAESDVIGGFSQGGVSLPGMPVNVGQFACASVCGRAIYELVTSESKKIDDPAQIETILQKGVNAHIEGLSLDEDSETPGSKLFIEDVMPVVTSNLATKQVPVKLTAEDKAFGEDIYSFDEGQFLVLTAAPEGKPEEGQSVLLFRQDEKFCIFNSHGTTFNGVPRGASVRQFDTANDLKEYVESLYSSEGHSMSGVLVKQEQINQ